MVGVEAVHAADEVEIFGCGESAEEREAFRDDADLALDLDGVSGGVEAEDLDAAGGWSEEAGEHLDGGGLACAVGAEEAEELAGRDGEVDVLNGGEVAESTREACGGDGGNHVVKHILRGRLVMREKVESVGNLSREIV